MERENSGTKRIIKKVLLLLVVTLSIAIVSISGFAIWSLWYYPQAWGSRDLGDGLYLLDFDHGKIIVYGTNIEGKACFGGEYIIPSFEESYSSDPKLSRKLIVLDAASNDDWLIAKLYNYENKENLYAVFDKRIMEIESRNWHNYVQYFYNILEFYDYCKHQDIDLSFAE